MVFKPGETTNPQGNNGHLAGYQRYADRAVYLQNKYTVGELMLLVGNKKNLQKLPVRDAQILVQLANTLVGMDTRLERESLLDRIEGKPKEPKEISGSMKISWEK